MIDQASEQLKPVLGTKPACAALGLSRATHYRNLRPKPPRVAKPRPAPPNALCPAEREQVLGLLRSKRFVDCAPAQVWAITLDEGRYLCSIPTMYRVLREAGESKERRRVATHPPRVRPELVAHAPNQCWSWDITCLKGPGRGEYYRLYVVLDIFSRYVVAWSVARMESAELARELIAAAVTEQAIEPEDLNYVNHFKRPPCHRSPLLLGTQRSVSCSEIGAADYSSRRHWRPGNFLPERPGIN